MKTYSELITLKTFEERFNYLYIGQKTAEETFSFYRYLNQKFYHSNEWRTFRRDMIIRDKGCEMALEPYEICGSIRLHHIIPITPDDVKFNTDILMNPENVVCMSLDLHNALHYGDLNKILPMYNERKEGDTKLW